MRLGKRTRKRGALHKSIAFAQARARRIQAGPPLASPFPAPRPIGDLAGTIGLLTASFPWPETPEPAASRRYDVLVVVAEGRFFGGTYELCERARRALPDAIIIVSDVFVDPSQVLRARRAGADAIAPVLSALGPAGWPSSALVDAARACLLGVVPEVASLEELSLTETWGAPAAFVSLRDRDTFRPELDRARELCALAGHRRLVGLFGDSLPSEATHGVALLPPAHDRATHVSESQLAPRDRLS